MLEKKINASIVRSALASHQIARYVNERTGEKP